uniref:hypothetical protein n=1 Tax=Methylobacterium sp. B34 TaxID=95563 RepID=UPI00195547D0
METAANLGQRGRPPLEAKDGGVAEHGVVVADDAEMEFNADSCSCLRSSAAVLAFIAESCSKS